MQTALRKMGNSVGMIVPKAMLTALGAEAGTRFDLAIEDGKIVAMPIKKPNPREGWAEDADALVAAGEDDPVGRDWRDFGNDGDDELVW